MTDLRSLRKKMNYEALDAENIRVARNTLDNLQKQVMIWDKPERAPLVSKEASLTIKSSVDNIIDILNNKIAVVNKLILERRGDLKDIMNNFDFINKYNQLIEPLITTGINKSKQTAIETNLQLIENPVSELTILLKKLMNDNEFIDFSRIEGVFNAFSIYKNVEDQIDRGNYYKITPERVRSMSADYIRNLNAEGIRLLDVAKQQSNLPPNQRLQAYIDEMGPISKGDMAKLKKLYGEPIEKLGKDLEQQFKDTRKLFEDVMRSEGGLNRSQIDDLTNLLETQGTVSQTKMNELIRLYGENSAEMIRSIKESGDVSKSKIEELGKKLSEYKLKIGEIKQVRPFFRLTLDEAKKFLDTKLYAGDRDKLLAILTTNPTNILEPKDETYLDETIGLPALSEVNNILQKDMITPIDFEKLFDKIPNLKTGKKRE